MSADSARCDVEENEQERRPEPELFDGIQCCLQRDLNTARHLKKDGQRDSKHQCEESEHPYPI